MSAIEELPVPLPADAPPAGSCVRIEKPEDGLWVLVLDPPHRKLAVLDLALMRDLDLALEKVEGSRIVRGLVVTGREPLQFAAGADIDAIEAATDPQEVERLVAYGQRVFGRLAALGRSRGIRTVAAVGGAVPGGAFELALACRVIVAAEHPKTRIGLPETRLGILPAWGGSTRLPRRAGLVVALEAILSGRLYDARSARRKGLVDRTTPPGRLREVAADIALGRERDPRRPRGWKAWAIDKNPLAARFVADRARKQVERQTGGHYPAPFEAIDVVTRAPRTPTALSLEAEAHAAARLAVGPICKNLIGVFRMSEDAKRSGKLADGSRPAPVERAGVLGAGVMGGGIAALFALKGTATRLFDISGAALDQALLEHRADVAKRVKRRRLERHQADAAIDRLDDARALAGFERAQLVVEAVAERLDVKREVLGELARQITDDAVVATNTSSLSVDAIADGVPHPERVVGMHFFNPVAKMPLVEVVRGPRTSEAVVARTCAFALALGKTPVVCADRAGFVVNRLLGPYLDEALRLLVGGVYPGQLEAVAKGFGLPMGPLQLLDEVGFDVASHAARSLHEAFGERMEPCTVLEPLVARGRLGKKSGQGFYDHGHGHGHGGGHGHGPELAGDVTQLQATDRPLGHLSEEVVRDRMLLAMLNEGVRALDEGVVASAAELDLATVFGMGFPPFRGGLLRWADSLGAARVVERLRELQALPDVGGRPGGLARFEPAPLLVRMAQSGERFRP